MKKLLAKINLSIINFLFGLSGALYSTTQFEKDEFYEEVERLENIIKSLSKKL